MINFADFQDPLRFMGALWPSAGLYREERETVVAVREAVETHVVAGNKLGKDYTAGGIALTFFLVPWLYFPLEYVLQVEAQKSASNPFPHTRRVVATSVKDDHLDVLWGEMGRWVRTCRTPLLASRGGPLVMNHHEIRLAWEKDETETNVLNYLKGMVSATEEGMSGHHAAYTLAIGDEASGLSDACYKAMQGWGKRFLFFGNANDTRNFWRKAVEGGDLLAPDNAEIVAA